MMRKSCSEMEIWTSIWENHEGHRVIKVESTEGT
jgi:hypothetical protein